MKTIEEINIETSLEIKDFFTLFELQLPLNEEEKYSLHEYYKMYNTFLDSEVNPKDAWLAIKNIFIIKNQQIKERIYK